MPPRSRRRVAYLLVIPSDRASEPRTTHDEPRIGRSAVSLVGRHTATGTSAPISTSCAPASSVVCTCPSTASGFASAASMRASHFSMRPSISRDRSSAGSAVSGLPGRILSRRPLPMRRHIPVSSWCSIASARVREIAASSGDVHAHANGRSPAVRKDGRAHLRIASSAVRRWFAHVAWSLPPSMSWDSRRLPASIVSSSMACRVARSSASIADMAVVRRSTPDCSARTMPGCTKRASTVSRSDPGPNSCCSWFSTKALSWCSSGSIRRESGTTSPGFSYRQHRCGSGRGCGSTASRTDRSQGWCRQREPGPRAGRPTATGTAAACVVVSG